jgi:hypothetical protein
VVRCRRGVLHSFVSFELWGIAAPLCHSICRLGLATPSYRSTRSCSTLALVSFDRWALGIGRLAPPCYSTWRCSVLHGLVSFDIAPLGCRTSASSEMSGWGLELVFVREVGLSFPQLGWPGAHVIWPAWLSFRPPCCCLAVLIVIIAI